MKKEKVMLFGLMKLAYFPDCRGIQNFVAAWGWYWLAQGEIPEAGWKMFPVYKVHNFGVQ